jgi:aspartyl-tRNA(Asn)/glutamyl-tRNA(Gln) amidotransferase subunit A
VLLGWPPGPGDASGVTARDWSGLRITRLAEAEAIGLSPAITSALDSVDMALSRAGATLNRGSMPAWQPGGARRAGLLLCELEGHAWWRAALGDEMPGLSTGLAAMLRYPLGLPESRIEQAWQTIEALRRASVTLFDSTDLLLLPTAAQLSFPHGEPAPANQADLTALANFIGAPALAIPVESAGALASVQLIAAPGRDELLLSLARAIDSLGTPSVQFPFARRI